METCCHLNSSDVKNSQEVIIIIIRKNHKLHKDHGNLEGGIDCRRKNPSRGKNPKRHLLRRFPLVSAIPYSNDATQLRI